MIDSAASLKLTQSIVTSGCCCLSCSTYWYIMASSSAEYSDAVLRRRSSVDRILARIGLVIEVRHDLVSLADLGAAISEVQIVAVRIWLEREGDAEPGVAVAEWKDGLGCDADELVADQVGVGEAVAEAPL